MFGATLISRGSCEVGIRSGRVLGQWLRVVGVFVPGQAAIDGLAKEIWQGELVVASARIRKLLLDQDAQAETLVQLAWQRRPGVGCHCRTMRLDAKLRIG